MAKIDPKHLKKYTVKWILSNEPLDFFMRIAKSFEHHMDRRMPCLLYTSDAADE